MSGSFLNKLSEDKRKQLLVWRDRYSKNEYPIKIAKNLLYESFTSGLMWEKRIYSFDGNIRYTDFWDAWDEVYSQKARSIQTEEVLPILDNAYNVNDRNVLAEMNFLDFKNRCENCSDKTGHNYDTSIEEIEFSYYYYTGIYMCIYGFYAYSLLGFSRSKSLEEIAGINVNSSVGENYLTLIPALGIPINLNYQKLQNY